MYKNFIKRLLDVLIALFAFICFMPVFMVIYILLYLKTEDGVFFKQKRPGLNRTVFTVYKFKTMNDKRDFQGNLLPDEQRLTSLGKFIRATSLDEIPQLLNVIKGDMSLVGPRPLLVKYLPLYNDFQNRRHEVKPGITGWAQVNGRNTISWDKKFEYDVWYVNNVSFLLDMKILCQTFLKVVKRTGINSQTNATMDTFTGNN